MIDREKVMRGIEACAGDVHFVHCRECPYKGIPCITPLLRDALALLKEQEERIKFLEKWTAYLEGGDPYEGTGVLSND